ncbi:hypothetical protein FRC03_008112 [Tulasnella sp. 419]|nr:hypothetical protein FRC03_008112 [Tulasnella sp. 419]
MSLMSVGGKADGGVDLVGWWWLPYSFKQSVAGHSELNSVKGTIPRRRLRVVAQCKAEEKKISPKYVRELEGVSFRYSHLGSMGHLPTAFEEMNQMSTQDSPRGTPVIALLLSSSPFSKSAIMRAQSSPLPIMLMHLPTPEQAHAGGESRDQIEGTAMLNPALASEGGLLDGALEIRWERRISQSPSISADDSLGRLAIWWEGKRLKPWTPDMSLAQS